MEPQYSPGYVKGEATYRVTANGYFNSALKMKFDISKAYNLAHEGGGSQAVDKIPYDISCTYCDVQQIVVDGAMSSAALSVGGVVSAPPASDKSIISYDLNIGYQNRGIDEVKTGRYSDTFTVLFGLDL
jgi:hypothetical protein